MRASVATAASSPVFQNLSKEGLLLDSFYALTHPSEPNYIAAVGGDFFGAGDDDFCEYIYAYYVKFELIGRMKTISPKTSRRLSISSKRRTSLGPLVSTFRVHPRESLTIL